MSSCSIIIFNYESIGFLKLCVQYIRKYSHPDILQHIYIADQSVEERDLVELEFSGSEDVSIVHMDALYSGYAVDYIMRNVNIQSEYICTLDCDAFPIHKDWLHTPIKLLEVGFSFIGGLFFETDGTNETYPNSPFFCLTQCYRIGRTEDYKKLAFNGGFSRNNVRDRGGISYLNDDWNKWIGSSKNIDKWSDDAVIAHYWEDKYCPHYKVAMPITHSIGRAFGESDWGGIIGNMVFHLGYSHWSNTIEDSIGKEYRMWKERLNNGDDIIEDLAIWARDTPTHQKPLIWNGELKSSEPLTEDWKEFTRIKLLKNDK